MTLLDIIVRGFSIRPLDEIKTAKKISARRLLSVVVMAVRLNKDLLYVLRFGNALKKKK